MGEMMNAYEELRAAIESVVSDLWDQHPSMDLNVRYSLKKSIEVNFDDAFVAIANMELALAERDREIERLENRAHPSKQMIQAWKESADDPDLSYEAQKLRRNGESYVINCAFYGPLNRHTFLAIDSDAVMMVGLEGMAIIPVEDLAAKDAEAAELCAFLQAATQRAEAAEAIIDKLGPQADAMQSALAAARKALEVFKDPSSWDANRKLWVRPDDPVKLAALNGDIHAE